MGINILFVCTGNTCRSPMASALLSQKLKEKNITGYTISSAGTETITSLPASDKAIQVLKEEGIDISRHKSQPLTKNLVEKADLILALARSHSDSIKNRFPEAAGKTFLLSEYSDKKGKSEDIQDPMGAPLEIYRDTRDQIKGYVAQIASKM